MSKFNEEQFEASQEEADREKAKILAHKFSKLEKDKKVFSPRSFSRNILQ